MHVSFDIDYQQGGLHAECVVWLVLPGADGPRRLEVLKREWFDLDDAHLPPGVADMDSFTGWVLSELAADERA